MKQNPTFERVPSNAAPSEPVRKSVLMAIGLVLVVCVGGAVFFANREKTAPKPQDDTAVEPVQPSTVRSSIPRTIVATEEVVETTGAAATAPVTATQLSVPRQTHAAATDPSRPQPSAETRQLVSLLTQLDLSRGPMTAEQAAAWKQNLQQLTAQGAAAVPAIREFLEKNMDMSFDAASGSLLGESTVRLSMLEALKNIGGPEALALSTDMLQTTLDPKEIAWLAQSLEQQAPGQYAGIAAQAARDALAAAAAGQLEGRDVGALFGLLQKFGSADDLEKFSAQYRYYTTIALAGMGSAGVPILLQMLNSDSASKGSQTAIIQALAQAAPQSEEALQALLDKMRRNEIPNSLWPNIGPILCGEIMQIGVAPVESGVRSFHLASGNQNFFTMPDRSVWAPDRVNRNVSIVNQFSALNNNNPTAATALKSALDCLQARLQ